MAVTYYHDTIAADSPTYAGQGTIGSSGTVVGSPGSVAGPTADTADYGLQLDGSTEYVESGFFGAPHGSGPFSIELWVLPASAGGVLVGAENSGGTVPDIELVLGSSSGVQAHVNVSLGGGGTTYCVFGLGTGVWPGQVRVGVWNHIVVTWDGSRCVLYTNGLRWGSANATAPFAPYLTTPLLVGADGQPSLGSPTSFCDAAIADVAFYSRPLTAKKVLAHYAARGGVPAYPSVGSYTGDYYPTIVGDNPVAYYRCDETAGTKAIDRSGNGHNGVYGGGSFTESEPGAIYDGNDAVLLAETPPSGGWDPRPAGLLTPLLSASASTEFSVEAWVDANALPTDAAIAATCGDTETIDGYGFRFYIDTSGRLCCTVSWAGGTLTAQTAAVPSGQYNYVVATFDLDDLILYVNGVQAARQAASAPLGPWATNLVFGFYGKDYGGATNQFGGTVDELALYNYALTPGQVYEHYIAGLGPLPPPPATATAGNEQHYFQVAVYDQRGNLIDIPHDDIDSLSLLDQLNGGSATSTISFIRDINAAGKINYLNSVLVWIWNGSQPKPLNPTWQGYMVDIDEEKTQTLGKLTVHLEGDAKQLDRAAVYEDVNPLIGGNPPLDAADYMRHLYTTYSPPGFCSLVCPSTLFPLLPGQYEMMQLGQVIDTVLKTGRDDLGNLITWRVSRNYKLQRDLIIQSDQDPNTVGGVKFRHIFMEMCAKYDIHTKYSEIVNNITVQGGQDYITGLPVIGSYIDDDSVAAFGVWQQIISVWQLISQSAADSYAETFLDIHGNPQANGDIELHAPDYTLLSGVWIQVWENASVIKQMRISSVRWEVGRSRIKQTLTPTAPTPYLDKAVYQLGLRSANNGTNQISKLPVNSQYNFVRGGGVGSAI